MAGMRRIRLGMRMIGSGNGRNQGENLPIGEKMVNENCVLQNSYYAKMQQIYRRSPIQKCDFDKAAKQKFLHKSAFLGMSISLSGEQMRGLRKM